MESFAAMNKGTPGLGIHVSPRLLQPPQTLEQLNTVSQLVNHSPLRTLNSDTPPRGVSRTQTKPSDEDTTENIYQNSRHHIPGSNEKLTPTVVDLGPDWQGSEIDTVLGDEKSRLKSGARLLPRTSEEVKGMALEKAKRRSRVDLDIFLKSDICVEGGFLQGLVKIFIRKGSKKSKNILLSGGKVRVIGFESLAKEEDRWVFYQCCADLSDVSSGLFAIYCSGPDSEGFMRAKEGIHDLPFTLRLASSKDQGTPKGYINNQSGVSIRYIVMVSLRVKDSTSGKISISHFYRDCCVWPRLNPSLVLSSASRPVQMTTSDGPALGGSGKVILTASLHRLYWVAGQLCHVRFDVTNNSKKLLKVLTLELFQTISAFKPKPKKSENGDNIHHPTTTTKQIARSTLTTGDAGTRGHASAKGWWAGVAPQTSQTFSHCIHLPTDSLSIPRGKLIEVTYNIKSTIGTGALLSTDICVSIPIEIISFLSIDPPPPPVDTLSQDIKGSQSVESSQHNTVDHYLDPDYNSEDSPDSPDEYSDDDPDELGNLSVHDDTDEMVQHVVSSAQIVEENAPRFADLYYSYFQNTSEVADNQKIPNLDRNGDQGPPTLDLETPQRATTRFADRVEEKLARRKKNLVDDNVDMTKQPLCSVPPLGNAFNQSFQAKNEAPKSVSFTPGELALDSNEDINPDRSTSKQKRIQHIPPKDGEVLPSVSKDCTTTPPRKAISSHRSTNVTPNRHPSIEMLTSSATRPKSVRDKIRELEELAAGPTADA